MTLLDRTASATAQGCIALAAKFRAERPDMWTEDWGDGPNPALRPAWTLASSVGEEYIDAALREVHTHANVGLPWSVSE